MVTAAWIWAKPIYVGGGRQRRPPLSQELGYLPKFALVAAFCRLDHVAAASVL